MKRKGLKIVDFCPKGGFRKLGDLGGTFADLVTNFLLGRVSLIKEKFIFL